MDSSPRLGYMLELPLSVKPCGCCVWCRSVKLPGPAACINALFDHGGCKLGDCNVVQFGDGGSPERYGQGMQGDFVCEYPCISHSTT